MILARGRDLVDQCRIDAPVQPADTSARRVSNALREGRWNEAVDLRGPFSVVGSSRSTGQVFLARDHMGQRPLYYAVLPGAVVASSFLPEVLDHPDVDDTVDPEALALNYARCYPALRERTIYSRVAQVPPGTVVTIGDHGVRHHRFWDPQDVGPPVSMPLPDRVRALRQLLHDVVAEYSACAPGAVAAQVSGGLDSTAVAAFADGALRRQGSGLVAAYSWAPSPRQVSIDLPGDERRFVLEICRARDWEPRFAPDLPAPTPSPGDPLRAPAMAWFHESRVITDAHDRGVRVMLTGWGGDEAISGHGKLRVPELLRRGHTATAVREVRHWSKGTRAQVHTLSHAARQVAGDWLPAVAPEGRNEALNEELLDVWRSQWPAVADALHRKWAAYRTARTVRDWHVAHLGNGHVQARNASWYLGGLPFGVEHRSPLQDPRIVEFALTSDSQCFQYRGWRRVLFRLAISGTVPDSVAWRLGKDDPMLGRGMIAAPPPIPDPRQPHLRPIAALARRQQEVLRRANRHRAGLGVS